MGFMGLGPGELLIILVLAILVFGPGKLPEIGKSLGKGMKEFKKATDEVMEPVNEVKQSVKEIKQLPTSLLSETPSGEDAKPRAAEPVHSVESKATAQPAAAGAAAAEAPAKKGTQLSAADGAVSGKAEN